MACEFIGAGYSSHGPLVEADWIAYVDICDEIQHERIIDDIIEWMDDGFGNGQYDWHRVEIGGRDTIRYAFTDSDTAFHFRIRFAQAL